MTIAKIAYGAVFTIAVPCAAVFWARAAEPNIALRPWGSRPVAAVLIVGGALLMIGAMAALWRFGGGLPMNAFPPPRLVRRGAFRWIPHPIYTGFTAAAFGLAMWNQSAAGLWLVAPVVGLACAALVWGYEQLDLERRFGETLRWLPTADAEAPSTAERLRFYILVVIPWIVLYSITLHMDTAAATFAFDWEQRLPVWSWTAPVYLSCYAAVAAAPWLAGTRADLRRLIISSFVAMALVFPFYWLVPSLAPRRPLPDGMLAGLLRMERGLYPPTAAMPSFHVLWAVFVARLVRPRWAGTLYWIAMAVSCVTTGMHYAADVVVSLAIAPLLVEPRRMWMPLRRLAERCANAWREWRFGPVRVINHAAWAAAAGFVPVLAATSAVEPGREWTAFAAAMAGLFGAALWAQLVEGSNLLRRPFGFYGGLIAVGVASLFFDERWRLIAAFCASAPWMQAIGRLRCFVNGCCHGAPSSAAVGIRVTHPRSRVTRLAGLGGQPIHPTQLYSILSNTVLGLLLARMWTSGCPLSLVCGVYAIGNGLARFVEEAYRGEPQTRIVAGLRLYQWIAIASVMLGAWLTTLPGPYPPEFELRRQAWEFAAVFAVLAGAAMGVDFPEADAPFARLASE